MFTNSGGGFAQTSPAIAKNGGDLYDYSIGRGDRNLDERFRELESAHV